MGTSQSSKGSPSGVPMVPPWVPDPPPPPPVPPEAEPEPPQEPGSEPATEPTVPIDLSGSIPTAPAGRFPCRKHHTSPRTPATAIAPRCGVALANIFRRVMVAVEQPFVASRVQHERPMRCTPPFSGGAAALGIPDANVSAGNSAQEVMDAVTEAVRPVDGTQDTESSRAAIQDALAETLTQFPDADPRKFVGGAKGSCCRAIRRKRRVPAVFSRRWADSDHESAERRCGSFSS